MGEKRVIEQVASNEVHNDDWFLKDSPTQDTSKISATNLKAILGADGTLALEEIANAIAEEYDSTSTYNKDDFAFYENKLYRCLANNTTGTWDGEKWEEFDIPTALITTAHNIETAEFTIGTYYSADDLVLKDGKLYQCVVFHNATEWKSQFWRSVTIDEMLGYLSDSLAPEHNPSTVYAVGDLVTHNKALWRCTQAGAGAFVNANWEEVTVVSLIAEAGQIDDVKVDGVSVVDENKVAQITTPDADGISYDNATSGLEADDVQEAIDEVVTDIESVETALETKADVDGFYDELFAGNLVTDMHTVDNKPYLYRQSPSASSVSQNIVGGTVAWNQLVQNGNFASGTTGWAPYSANGTITASNNELTYTLTSVKNTFYDNTVKAQFNHIPNHIYFSTYDIYVSKTSKVNTKYINGSITQDINAGWSTLKIIFKTNGAGTNGFYGLAKASDYNYEVGDTYKIKNVNLIDLTQAFGSTIADYIYSLEQAEAGSGIAWLKANGFLTKDYYPYDSGKLESVNVSARKVVGFNQWDEQVRNGYYDANSNPKGEFVANANMIASVNPIKVIPSTLYYIKSVTYQIILSYYDVNMNFISQTTAVRNTTFTTPSNCVYLQFSNSWNGGSTYNNDICINISDASKNGTYEPYSSTTYDLSGEHEVNRKFGIVDLGSLTWVKGNMNTENTGRIFYSILSSSPMKQPSDNGIVSDKLVYNPFSNWSAGQWERQILNGITVTNSAALVACVPDNYSTASDFKTAMNGVYLVYELATPTTETVTNPELRGMLKLDANNKLYYYGDTMSDIPNPQLVGSTEEFVDAGTYASTPTRDVAIPVGQDSKYHTDLKAKLEELAKIPDVPSSNGTYTLKATRSASGVEYNWVSG